ncbi:MAG TPA: DHHA1 domain-containing protein, partial [Saprospiraceae bacterium]|nr:DHHA1 domain-containing protein [Saprospiraceae bacterium]
TFSIELCGGCHVKETGTIGFFKITSESAIAAGVRRIEAITAEASESYINDQLTQLSQIRQELKNPIDAVKAIKDLHIEIRELRRQIEEIEISKASELKSVLLNNVQMINGVNFVASEVNISDQKLLKTLIYQVGNELNENSFLLIGSKGEGKAQLMLFISEDLVKSKNLHAGHIIKELALSIQGGGGGQPFFASAGGTAPEGLEQALLKARDYILN